MLTESSGEESSTPLKTRTSRRSDREGGIVTFQLRMLLAGGGGVNGHAPPPVSATHDMLNHVTGLVREVVSTTTTSRACASTLVMLSVRDNHSAPEGNDMAARHVVSVDVPAHANMRAGRWSTG